MDVIEILNSDLSNFETISKYYSKYLNDIHKNDFSFAESMNLVPLAEKFIRSASLNSYIKPDKEKDYLSKVYELFNGIRKYNRSTRHPVLFKWAIPFNKRYLSIVEELLQEVYSFSIKIIDETNQHIKYTNRRSTLNVNDFFDVRTSSKSNIVILIEEAEEFINLEESFTTKTKETLFQYLDQVKEDIKSDSTNWSSSLGKIKEVIIFLAAASTLIVNSSNIIYAKNKLIETENVIQNTSININHKTINNTFIQKRNELNLHFDNQVLGIEYTDCTESEEE